MEESNINIYFVYFSEKKKYIMGKFPYDLLFY